MTDNGCEMMATQDGLTSRMRSKADFPKSEDSASWMRNLKLPIITGDGKYFDRYFKQTICPDS